MKNIVSLPTTRKVIFEKYDMKIAINEIILSALDGCEIGKNYDTQSSYELFRKDGLILFAMSNKILYIRYNLDGLRWHYNSFDEIFKDINFQRLESSLGEIKKTSVILNDRFIKSAESGFKRYD